VGGRGSRGVEPSYDSGRGGGGGAAAPAAACARVGDRFFRDGAAVHAAGVGLTASARTWRAGDGTKRIDRRRRRCTARTFARLTARARTHNQARQTRVATALTDGKVGRGTRRACVREFERRRRATEPAGEWGNARARVERSRWTIGGGGGFRRPGPGPPRRSPPPAARNDDGGRPMGGGRGGVRARRNRLLCRTGPTGCTPARRATSLGRFIARSSVERFASSVRTLPWSVSSSRRRSPSRRDFFFLIDHRFEFF